MPRNFRKITAAEDAFNKKYGVDFSIEAFDERISVFDDFGGGSDINFMYRFTFKDLFKKAFGNFIDHKLGRKFDASAMIKDFEKTIMTPYREELKKEGRNDLVPFGGWSVKTYMETIQQYTMGLPSSKVDFAEARYHERIIRIRDMRAFANSLRGKENVTIDELATLSCYSVALANANEERTRKWAWRHPFKYFAEKREAKNFQDLVVEKLGDPEDVANAAKYNALRASMESNSIDTCKVAVDMLVSRLQYDKNAPWEPAANKKEKVSVSSALLNDDPSKKSEKVEYKNPSVIEEIIP